MASFVEVKIDIKSERPKMSSKWSHRVVPKPPINRSKIKLLFASVFGCLGEASDAGPDLIFDDHLNENNGFLSAPWAAFWSGFGAQMRFRCGPRWFANVAKNRWSKST